MLLGGVRILEFSIAWAGPLAGRTLGDLGAEVIRVERPDSRGTGLEGIGGDRIEQDIAGWTWGQLPGPVFRSGIYPDADPRPRPWNRQGLLNKLNRNKRSLCIELKEPGGQEVLRDLVRASDVVLNNYSPRGAVSLGIDHDTLVRINPRVITVAMSGYGHTGPDAMRVSLGPILEAHSGLVSATGYPDRGPLKMGVAFPDPIGSLHATVAVLGALRWRAAHGKGVSVDLSQFESYASVVGEHYLTSSVIGAEPPRTGNRSPNAAPQGVYRCAGDDDWLAISVESDQEWAALARVLGSTVASDRYATMAGRQSDHDTIDRAIEAWTGRREKQAAMAELQDAGVRAVAVMNSRDLVDGDHLNARGYVAEWDQPDVGPRRFPGFPVHFERPAKIPMRGAPTLGADNEYVLGEILGYPEDRIDALRRAGVIATTPPGAS